LAVAVLRRLLELDDRDVDSEVFRRRADAFLFQRVAGRRLRVAVGARRFDVGPTDRTGHFRTEIELDESLLPAATDGATGCRWLSFTTVPDEEDEGAAAVATGRIQPIDDSGLSVISDIDDTVKVTNVADRRELLRNTFVREFTAVEGMPEAFRRWAATGAAFHYVSASPWQLSACLCDFLAAAGLPSGSMHLKLFRLKDSTPLGRLTNRKRSKRRAVEQIMADFPGRRFVLVGDSGERDPEVYAAVARRRPEQVVGLFIRRVPGRRAASHVSLRFDKLARGLPAGLIRSFVTAEQLADELATVADHHGLSKAF